MGIGTIFILIIGLIVVGVIFVNVRIVSQSEAFVIQRLGAYKTTWGTGIHVKIPFIEEIANKVSLKETVLNFPAQSVITSDNVTIKVDSVIYYQVTDPKRFTYGAEDPLQAIRTLTATNIRNIIGDLDLDKTLTSRDTINEGIRQVLDEASDNWGIKVNRVEINDIIPPEEIQKQMERQMKAERERRESILIAEGEKKSQILRAEGNKESVLLNAQAEYERKVLQAKAQKEWEIQIAEGQAEAIRINRKAEADGIRLINEAKASHEFLALQALNSLEKLGEGQATKIIIPSEIQNLAGLVTSFTELAKSDANEKEVPTPNEEQKAK